jgi:hypothetical protein
MSLDTMILRRSFGDIGDRMVGITRFTVTLSSTA